MTPPPQDLRLPFDRPRPSRPSFRGGAVSTQIDAQRLERWRGIGAQAGATMFMTVMAGFSVLLHRQTGQTDIAVGSPVAAKPHPELEGLIGFFVDTQVVRNHLAGNPSFLDLVRSAKASVLEEQEDRDIPFQLRLNALPARRGPAAVPLFRVWLNHMRALPPAVADGPLKFTALPGLHLVAKYDLMLTLIEDRASMRVELAYKSDLFDRSSAQSMLGELLGIMDSAAADTSQTLSVLADAATENAVRAARAAQAHLAAGDRDRLRALVGRAG